MATLCGAGGRVGRQQRADAGRATSVGPVAVAADGMGWRRMPAELVKPYKAAYKAVGAMSKSAALATTLAFHAYSYVMA